MNFCCAFAFWPIVIICHFIGRQLGPHTNNCQMYNFSCEHSYLPFNLWHGGSKIILGLLRSSDPGSSSELLHLFFRGKQRTPGLPHPSFCGDPLPLSL